MKNTRLRAAIPLLLLIAICPRSNADLLVTSVERSVSVDLTAGGFAVPDGLSFHQTDNGPASGPWVDAISGSLDPDIGGLHGITFSAVASQDSLVTASSISFLLSASYSRTAQPSRPLLTMEGSGVSTASVTFTITSATQVQIEMGGTTTFDGPYDYGGRYGLLRRVGGANILAADEGSPNPLSLLTTLTPGDYTLSGFAIAEQTANISFDAGSAERVMSITLTVVPATPGWALLVGGVAVAFRRRRSSSPPPAQR